MNSADFRVGDRSNTPVERLRSFLAQTRVSEQGAIELEWLAPSALDIDSRIQRPVRSPALKNLTKFWDLKKCGPITVSRRDDGALIVICGQHRWRAAKANKVPRIPALVLDGLTKEDEAQVFLAEDNRVRITPFDRLMLRQEAGDLIALEIGRMVAESGYRLAPAGDRGKKGALVAVAAIEGAHRRGVLPQVLRVTRKAWGDESVSLAGPVIAGLGIIFEKGGGEINPARLSKSLADLGYAGIMARAYGIKLANEASGARAIALAIMSKYNHGLKNKITAI